MRSSFLHDAKHAAASTSASASRSSSKQKATDDGEHDLERPDAIDSDGVIVEGRKMTEAERKFEEVRKKRMHQRIAKEARTSHKEKVDAFNKYLGSLSEHHDIPKVGPG